MYPPSGCWNQVALTMSELDLITSENSATSNEGSSMYPKDDSTRSQDSMDVNGGVKLNCDYLPNNNMCDDVVSSVCASSEICGGGLLQGVLSPSSSAANMDSSLESQDSQDGRILYYIF